MANEAEQVLTIRKLRAASLYKLLLLGLLISSLPLGLFFGVLAFFGADTVKWNGEAIHGAAALVAGPAVSAFVSVVFALLVGTLTCVGLWLLSRFRPITIRVVLPAPRD